MKIAVLLLLRLINSSAIAQSQLLQQQLKTIFKKDTITGIQIAYLKDNKLTNYCLGKMGVTGEILVYMTNDSNGLKEVEKVLGLFPGNQTYWSVKWLN